MQIAPSGSTRGRGDQTADSGPAQVDPVRAVYRGENVCDNAARGRLRATRAVPSFRLLVLAVPGISYYLRLHIMSTTLRCN